MGTHEKRLSRVFKELTNRTVFEFVREARLHEAQRLLLEPAMRIEEIAATAFREYFDCTPSVCCSAWPCGCGVLTPAEMYSERVASTG